MTTSKKTKKPVRRSPRCVVCLENPRDAGYSKICDACDVAYEIALATGKGTVEWAATRAREFAIKRLRDER